jgi:hypothetical protein
MADQVLRRVVLEALVARHYVHDLEQTGFGIVAHAIRRDHPVVPVVAAHESFTIERIGRPRGEHGAVPFRPHDRERALVVAAENLERLTAAHEIILYRIEREQDANPALEIRVQDHHVAVALGAREDADPITLVVVAVPVEPDLNGWIR